MDPDQTTLDLHCLSKRLKIFQQPTNTYDLDVGSVYIRSGFS